MARLSIAALAALFMLACDAPPPPSTTPVSRAAEAPTDLTTARPKKGAVIGGELVDRTIAWPDAGAIDPALRDRLEASARDRVDGSAVPVLLPATATARANLATGEGWYAFSTHDDAQALSIYIQGSAKARLYPHIESHAPTQTVRGQGAFVSRNEGIWVVRWIEHGAAYTFELECDDPRAAACASPDHAVELVQTLAFVGGKGTR